MLGSTSWPLKALRTCLDLGRWPVLVTFLITLLSAPVFSDPLVAVSPGTTEQIFAHGTCRDVSNLGTDGIMVPIRSAEEWVRGEGAFLTHVDEMPNVAVDNCTFLKVTLSCGELSSPVTIQSQFTTEEWASEDPKILTIPSTCNLCLVNAPDAYAMSIGDTPWGGELTLRVEGALTGGSSGYGQAVINTLDVNRLGDVGQKINLVVDGGRIIGGGQYGRNGDSPMFTVTNGTSCYAYGTSGYCNNSTYHATGGQGGLGGRGEHCGTAPQPGAYGFMGATVAVPDDRLWTAQQQKCGMQSVYVYPQGNVSSWVCTWVTYYYVSRSIRYVIGPTGGTGQPGTAGGGGIRNLSDATIQLLNGGQIRGY